MTYGLNDVVIHRSRIDESQAPEEQKRIERGKLDALLAWCEIADCRRVALLRYFGEELGAPGGKCGNCDTCLEPPVLWDGTEAARKAMSAALRTGQRFGAAHLTDVLRGKRTEKVGQYGHDALPTFGVGADLDDTAWRGVFRQLLAAGLLHAEAAEFGALKLTEAARPLLKGEATLSLRRPRKGAGAKGQKSAVATRRDVPADLGPEAAALFDRLRAWRGEEARRQGVPAYVILHDRSLRELAQHAPADREALLDVAGIGEAKAARYGESLLRIIVDA